jgi:hypothetical protein
VYVIGNVPDEAFHDKETVPPSAVNATKFCGWVGGADIILLSLKIII